MLDSSKNFFEWFDLPVGYAIDGELLSQRYRELQRLFHPDRFAGGTDQERRLSLQGSMRINEAFEALREPILRGRYLLTLRGVDPDGGAQSTSDAEFLMEQMELREELDAARHAPDPFLAIGKIRTGINLRIQRLAVSVGEQLDEAAPDLEQARETLRKMQFLKKLRADAEHLEAELDDNH